MKFKKIKHYVEKSFEDKPSFVIEMSNRKEYISNGCVWVENTPENIQVLIDEYECGDMLGELMSSDSIDIHNLTNGRHMFDGCSSLTEFTAELPNLTNGWHMFRGCSSLTEFTSELPNLKDGRNMFRGCSSLTEFTAELPNLTNGWNMFSGCSSLKKRSI